MARMDTILALILCAALPAATQGQSAASNNSDTSGTAQPQQTNVDGIAVHIGNDVVTESEVREMEDYQQLLDGKSQSRAKILQELVDQWIVRTEAATVKFPQPTAADVNQEWQALLKHFSSPQDFRARLAAVNLTQVALRRVLERQLYYVRFLDYKFHAAAQVTSAQIEAYYQNDLSPQLQKQGAAIPPLTQVEARIRQLLTQEQINEKAAQWLNEAKSRLRIVIQPSEGGG